MVDVKVFYARDRDIRAWERRMFYRIDADAPRRLVAEFDLEVTRTRGVRKDLTPEEIAQWVYVGFNGVGKPLAAFTRAGVRTMSVGDVIEVDGVKLLCDLTGFQRLG